MVFYFTSDVVSPPVTLFMGLDKYENDDLIKWGWPEDVWFHVDKISSAHIYLRLSPVIWIIDFNRSNASVRFIGQTIDDIPSSVLEDACQLTKANSINGNKMNDVDVVYTMWQNLKKTPAMEVGQVSFVRDKQVRKLRVAKRNNEIINRLNKTKREEKPDLRTEREKRDRLEREDKKQILRQQKEKEREEERRKKDEAELRSYSTLMKPENMRTNYDSGNDSDDFM